MRRLLLLSSFVVVVPCACGGLEERPPVRAAAIYLVDTLRADHLSAYGYGRDTSPHLEAFAAAARSLATAPARLFAMKGRYPAAELEDLPGWVRVDSVEKLAVPGLQEDRHLVIMSVNA